MEEKGLSPWQSMIQRFLETDIRYLASGSFWLSLGQGISALLSLATAFAFANWLPKETYGAYKYILSIASILTIASLTDMATAVIQSAAKGEDGIYRAALRMKIRWGTIGFVGACVIGGYYFINGNRVLGTSFFLLAPFIPFVDSLALWSAYLGGKKLFKESTLTNMCAQAGISLSVLATLFLTNNLPVIIFVYFFSTAIFLYFAHLYTTMRHPEMRSRAEVSKESLMFGKKLSFVNIIGNIASQIDNLLLWHVLDPVQLANYAFAIATTNPAKRYMKTVFSLAQPKFSTTETSTLKATIHRKVLKSFLLFIPMTVIYILALPFLYHWFFPKYTETIPYARALGLIYLFFPFKLYTTALITRENKKATYQLVAGGPIVRVILLFILIPMYGVWGAIATTLISYVTSSLSTWYLFVRHKD
jgi:O-antigen/teichoic acid export membrane protein